MYSLSNSDLTVSILDPVADVALLGSRYCTGGYIHQVTDAAHGELLSGPEYPDPQFNPFNGQGAPDMFHQHLGPDNVSVGAEVGCIGVGRVRCTSPIQPFDVRHNPEVIEFVNWTVEQTEHRIVMQTEPQFQAWAYRLVRDVSLEGRTVHSRTEIQNLGQSSLPVRWFPHPFWPLTEDGILCRFSIPVSMSDNPGYAINAENFIGRKAEHDWVAGWYQALAYEADGRGLTIVQKHPKIGEVSATTDYDPTFLPIWGNDRTFSFEPYLEQSLSSDESLAWQVDYRF